MLPHLHAITSLESGGPSIPPEVESKPALAVRSAGLLSGSGGAIGTGVVRGNRGEDVRLSSKERFTTLHSWGRDQNLPAQGFAKHTATETHNHKL